MLFDASNFRHSAIGAVVSIGHRHSSCAMPISFTASPKSTIRKFNETIPVFLIFVLIFSSSFHPNKRCGVHCFRGDPLWRLFVALQNHSKTKLFRQFNDAMFVTLSRLHCSTNKYNFHIHSWMFFVRAFRSRQRQWMLISYVWCVFYECWSLLNAQIDAALPTTTRWLSVTSGRERERGGFGDVILIIIIVVVDVGSDSRYHEWNAM